MRKQSGLQICKCVSAANEVQLSDGRMHARTSWREAAKWQVKWALLASISEGRWCRTIRPYTYMLPGLWPKASGRRDWVTRYKRFCRPTVIAPAATTEAKSILLYHSERLYAPHIEGRGCATEKNWCERDNRINTYKYSVLIAVGGAYMRILFTF